LLNRPHQRPQAFFVALRVIRAQDHQFEFQWSSGFARRLRCPVHGREVPVPDPPVEAQERYSQAVPLLLIPH
jgi:hypothetical protein